MSDQLVWMYAELEFEIKKDIFKRLNKLRKVTDSTVHQTEILQQTSGLKSDIDRMIKKYDVKARAELKKLFLEAIAKAEKQDLKYFQFGKRELSANQRQIMTASLDRFTRDENFVNKTFEKYSKEFEEIYSSLTRMTLTVADASQTHFLKECNKAYMKVSSGAYSWQDAYKDSVIELAKNGVKTVYYNYSGKPVERSIESATRMNILTGINQTVSEVTLDNADDLGTDLVEVSAHIGARPEHEELQGRVYCLEGERDFVDSDGIVRHAPNFYTTCRFGEVDGICGINCRHSFYPYFEGTPLQYSHNELSEMQDKTVTLDGKDITPYEAEQELRVCERAIRSYKSEVQGLMMTGNENSAECVKARTKLYEWQHKASHITNETGIKRNYTNEFIGTPTGKQPTGLKPTQTIGSVVPTVPVDFSKLVDDTKTSARSLFESLNVETLDFGQLTKELTSKEITLKLGGGDKTRGSCSSLALAYAGNRGGFDITDYRGGLSRDIFSKRSVIDEIAHLKGVNSFVIDNMMDDFTSANTILGYITQKDKEYYLATGRHASIVKLTDKGFEYLELQSVNSNGFHVLNDYVLKDRFGCQTAHYKNGVQYALQTFLIDIESLSKNKEFYELLKYLNTNPLKQRKGITGGMK